MKGRDHIAAPQMISQFCFNLCFPQGPNPTMGVSLKRWPLFFLVYPFCFLLLPLPSSPFSLSSLPCEAHIRQQLFCTCVNTRKCLLSRAELLICARTMCYLQESQMGFSADWRGDTSVKYIRLFLLRPLCQGEGLDGWIWFIQVTPSPPGSPPTLRIPVQM